MKCGKIMMALAALLFCAGAANAQTATFTAVEYSDTRVIIVTVDWVADGSGDVSEDFDTDIPGLPDTLAGRHCYHAETIPGTASPPTALYDITVSTPGGISVFGTRLNDRSATVGEVTSPLVTSATDNVTGVFTVGFDSSLAGEVWTFTVANAGSGGEGTLRLFFR